MNGVNMRPDEAGVVLRDMRRGRMQPGRTFFVRKPGVNANESDSGVPSTCSCTDGIHLFSR